MFEYQAIYPEIIITLFALAVLLGAPFFGGEKRGLLMVLTLIGLAAAALASLNLLSQAQSAVASHQLERVAFDVGRTPQGVAFARSVVADGYALFFNLIFLVGAALTVLMSGEFLRGDKERESLTGEYYALLLFATLGMMIMAASNDLLVFFLGLETLSIALYILAGFARRGALSLEASMKYFLLGAFATGFLLYGIALVYGATQSTNVSLIAQKLARGELTSPTLLMVGAVLLLIGFGFKAALVPFHQWTPDVYEGAPTPVTAFMSVGAKAAALAAMLRVFQTGFSIPTPNEPWLTSLAKLNGSLSDHLLVSLWVVAALTMTVGNVVAVAQVSLKRMLAYSSIAHAGYLLIGVISATSPASAHTPALSLLGGATQSTGAASILFYLLVYAFMNIGAFSWVALMGKREGGDMTLEDCSGLAWRFPLAAAGMMLFMLSLAGVPPLAGFFAKLYIFRDGLRFYQVGNDPRLLWLVIIGVLNSVVAVFYYLRVVVMMYMYEPSERAAPTPASRLTGLAMTFCALAVVLIGLRPHGVWDMAVTSLMVR